MLRIILEDEKLIVKDVIVQSSEETCMGDQSVWMHSVSLEIEKKCNVEVQRSNMDHHLKKSAVQCIGHHGAGLADG